MWAEDEGEGKGFFCTKPPPEQLCWLLYPSSESLLEPRTEALFCLQCASLAPSPTNTCFDAPKPWETLSPHPTLAQALLSLGNGDTGVVWRRWRPRNETRPRTSLAKGREHFDREKSILCPQAGTDHSADAHVAVLP